MTPALDERLFASLSPLRLRGSTCTTCGTTTFPVQADCPRCARRTMTEQELPDHGTLWTWTVQSFEPKPPYVAPDEGFSPFPVGYVDLGDVLVEAVLDADPTQLSLGMPMRLVPLEVRASADDVMLGYAFSPEPS